MILTIFNRRNECVKRIVHASVFLASWTQLLSRLLITLEYLKCFNHCEILNFTNDINLSQGKTWSFLFLLLFLGLVFGRLGFVSPVRRYSVCARRPSPSRGNAFLRFIGTKTHNRCGSWFRTDGRFGSVFFQYATKRNRWEINHRNTTYWLVHGLNPMVLCTNK